jgi:endonuclease/exonuclease/phosphatase family metal-dependent hydrolase
MRLLSYNIHKGIGGTDRHYRLARVIDVIAAEQPDVVCLQEVDYNCQRSHYDNQPDLLRDRLHLPYSLFQLNHLHRGGGYGNLILSRWPLLTHHQISIRHMRRKNRGAQLVVIDTPGGALHVVNWHLGLREHERRWQAHHLLDHLHFQERAHLPTVIAGDFNDWRNSLGRFCFTAHRFEQLTAPVKHFRSFPAFFAIASLDKAYARGLARHEVAVVRHKIARRASDHLPLRVDFTLHPPAPTA